MKLFKSEMTNDVPSWLDDEKLTAEVLSAHVEKWGLTKTAARLGVSEMSVRRWLHDDHKFDRLTAAGINTLLICYMDITPGR